MNKKKMSKRQRDIKSKLMAAICMLLVSSIMMVSTTYAWFTLSTAPEVTGITTAVGANGNLEMALQRPDGDSAAIVTGTSDSVKPVKERNITWGNLVELKDNSATDIVYGLSKITLYPSKLNADGDIIKNSPLATPAYGADGRISSLVEKTITGVYSEGKFVESVDFKGVQVENAKGVRAIGISSGMSDRELAYRGAITSASSADSRARQIASSALSTNGAVLADVAIAHALKSDMEGLTEKAIYTAQQVAAMTAVLDALLNDGGAFDLIENALMQYVLADTLAAAADADTTDIIDAFNEIESTDDLAGTDSPFKTSYDKMVADGINFFTKLDAAKGAASEARTNLPSGKDNYAWSEIEDALAGLVNTSLLQINGMSVTEVMANPGSVASSILKNGLKLTMLSGAGVFADIADFCGNYSAGIVIPHLAYGDIQVDDVDATMETKTSANPIYLTAAKNAVAGFTGGGEGSTTSITDFYGYIVDLAFRTNAQGSKLQLQQEGIDRIYNQEGNEGTNPETMGGGSYMNFTSSSNNFGTAAMKNLMGAIRVVFFDTDTSKIVGYARLVEDTPDADASDGTKMALVMTDAAGAGKFRAPQTGETATHTAAGKLPGEGETATMVRDNTIMELTQNTIHELSVMVYLDGESVGNEDVAYDAAQSMSGSMNLQFSSSATLIPMEYADLRDGKSAVPETPAIPELPEGSTEMTNVTVNGSAAQVAYFKGTTVGVYVPTYTDGATVAITAAGSSVTQYNVTQNVLTFTLADVAANTAVEITVTAPADGG